MRPSFLRSSFKQGIIITPLLLVLLIRVSQLHADTQEEFATPMRFEQGIFDTGVSTTTINYREIQALGIDNLADALLLVPGFSVCNLYNGHSSAQYHSSCMVSPRGMLMKVNGATTWNSSFPALGLDETPVTMQDLKTIEVARGPIGSVYGSNAFGSAISMTSFDPQRRSGVQAETAIGSHNKKQSFFNYTDQFDNWSVSFSLFDSMGDGYDKGYGLKFKV